MSRKHFSLEQRKILEKLLAKNMSISDIADLLSFSRSAIYQEIRRNKNYKNKYIAETAHYKATFRRKRASEQKQKETPELIEYIRNKLTNLLSPEQISGRMKIDNLPITVCFKTIYRWLEEGRRKKHMTPQLKGYSKYLRIRGAGKSLKRNVVSTRGKKTNLPAIENRPETLDVGHWEADLVQGYKRSAYLLTMVDRISGVTLISYCARKSIEDVNIALGKLCRKLPSKYLKSITFDRGKEFYGYKTIEEKHNVACYFCNPSSPHERGLNENTNGLLRQIFPRTKDYSTITQEEIKRAAYNLNSRPRKRFKFKSPLEVLEIQGINLLYNFT